MGNRKPLNIIIIGGSCAGLFAGILLKRAGHNIRILELSLSNERSGTAAGVGLSAHVKKFFDENDRLKDVPFGTPSQFMEILNWDTSVQKRYPLPGGMNMTTWDATYYRLRANFDGFASAYCETPPRLGEAEGRGVFDTGKRVVAVAEGGEGVEVVVEDAETKAQERYTADFVIAADGANSGIRRQLQPHLRREEPGYVLWRGTVPTANLSKKTLERIEHRTILYQMHHSYAIIYTIPGPNGNLQDNHREINVAWYFWTTASERTSILTDTSGHVHGTTLPKGKMKPEIWARQLEHAKRMFHPEMVELVEKIQSPFVSVIASVCADQAVFFHERLFLIGDALALKQPNTAQGVNLAAQDAMSLVDVICGKRSVGEWEQERLEVEQRERLRSVVFASGFLNSWVGRWWYQVRFKALEWGQRWRKWWFGVAYPGVGRG